MGYRALWDLCRRNRRIREDEIMASIGHKIGNIEISVEPSEDGDGWAAQAWFPGVDGATYKEYAFGETEQEAVDAVVSEVKNNSHYQVDETAIDNEPTTTHADIITHNSAVLDGDKE